MGTNFAPGLRQEEEPNDVAIIHDRFIVREKYKTVRDVEGSFYDFYIVDNHYRYEDKYTPNIGKVTERIDGDISEVQDAVMETYEATEVNASNIDMTNEAIMELYELVTGGE